MSLTGKGRKMLGKMLGKNAFICFGFGLGFSAQFMLILNVFLGVSLTAFSQPMLKSYDFQVVPYSETTRKVYTQFLDAQQLHLTTLSEDNLAFLWPRKDSMALNQRFDTARCKEFYNNLYSKKTLLIRTVYGYYDSFGVGGTGSGGAGGAGAGKAFQVSLGDQAEVSILKAKFLKPCPNSSAFACGFTEMTGSQGAGLRGARLAKTIKGPNGDLKNVIMEFIHSSDTNSDRENRLVSNFNLPSASQRLVSEAAEKQFLGGFREADVLIYLGHARAGGGPSFFPPVLKMGLSEDPVNYGYYTSSQNSFGDMVKAFEDSSTPPKVFGLFACKSAPLFAGGKNSLSQRLQAALADRGTLFLGTSSLTTSNSDLGNYLGLMDSLLGLRCGAGFKRSTAIEIGGNKMIYLGRTP